LKYNTYALYNIHRKGLLEKNNADKNKIYFLCPKNGLFTNETVHHADNSEGNTQGRIQDFKLGGHEVRGSEGRKSPVGSRGKAPVGDLGDKVPQKLKPFCIWKHAFLLNFWITHCISNQNLTWRIYTCLCYFAITVL